MANIFFNQEKTPKEEARQKLIELVEKHADENFDVFFESDDGGNHIALVFEVDNPKESLSRKLMDSVWGPRWMGWRFVVVKVPFGYIDAVMKMDDDE